MFTKIRGYVQAKYKNSSVEVKEKAGLLFFTNYPFLHSPECKQHSF